MPYSCIRLFECILVKGIQSLCSCVSGAVHSNGAEMSLGSELVMQLPQAMCRAVQRQQCQMLCLVCCMAF